MLRTRRMSITHFDIFTFYKKRLDKEQNSWKSIKLIRSCEAAKEALIYLDWMPKKKVMWYLKRESRATYCKLPFSRWSYMGSLLINWRVLTLPPSDTSKKRPYTVADCSLEGVTLCGRVALNKAAFTYKMCVFTTHTLKHMYTRPHNATPYYGHITSHPLK